MNPSPAASSNRSWRAYLTEMKYECVRARRAPGFSLPTLLLPAAFYLFFGVVLADGDRTQDLDIFVFIGFAVMAVMGPGLFGFGAFVAVEREHGLLRLKRALPMPAPAYILAKLAMTMTFATLGTLGVITVAAASGAVDMDGEQIVSLGIVLGTGSLAFCAIGLLVGAYASARSAPAILNLLFLPMVYLSGLLIPLPDAIAVYQVVWPAYHLDQLALGVMGLTNDGYVIHGAALASITVLCGGLAMTRLMKVG